MNKKLIKMAVSVDYSDVDMVVFSMPYDKDFGEVLVDVAKEIGSPEMSIVDLLFDNEVDKLLREHDVTIVRMQGIQCDWRNSVMDVKSAMDDYYENQTETYYELAGCAFDGEETIRV